MGTIYQRKPGGTYYGYWTDAAGRSNRKSLRTRDQAVARARLRQHELVSTDRATHSHQTLKSAIGDLLDVVAQQNAGPTWEAYRQKGEAVTDVLGDVELDKLTREIVVSYVQHRRTKVSDSTIHKELVVLRRALHEARERGLWRGEPRSLVPAVRVRYQPRERWLTEDHLVRVLAELAGDRRLWVALAALGGLCLAEVERLEWSHVDLAGGSMRVPGTKRRDRWRRVPLHPALARLLKAANETAASARVVRPWGNVRRDIASAIKRANAGLAAATRGRKPPTAIAVVTPNDLRRTFASWLKQQGVDSLTVAHLLGHSSTRMVELVYGRLSDDTYRAAIAKMPRLRLRKAA